ncbi:MAG: FAD-binding oxidoreductase [Fimbriimonadaceae bacterium]
MNPFEPTRIRRLSGFGMTAFGDGFTFEPTSIAEITDLFDVARDSGRKLVLRGNGRSYGDASLLSEEIVLDIRSMNRVISWDPQTGIVECEGGVTIEQLWRLTLPDGWWPPVVSGTMFPTLAGALAMNIHGKNNLHAGTLGEHVLEMEVVTPTTNLTLQKGDELLSDFISSSGLLGVITRVKLQMKRVGAGELRVLARSQANWDEQFATFEELAQGADYIVSWVDCFARGNSSGRGLIHTAYYEGDAGETPDPGESFDLPQKSKHLWRVLKMFNNRSGMRLVNAAKHVSGKLFENGKERCQTLVEFSFLLDYVPDWRKAYLPGGFIQFQSFVPAEHARQVFARQISLQQDRHLESFLGVMKRHREDGFLLSHGVDGYSLAMDFKITSSNRDDVWRLCRDMSDKVIEAGGRFYLAKDSTLRPEDVQAVWGDEITRLRALKAKFDPDRLLSSRLAHRLNLE